MINIDLTKVSWNKVLKVMGDIGSCRYSGPCVIGSMMTVKERKFLKDTRRDTSSIMRLIEEGVVSAPEDQRLVLRSLQHAFDGQYEDRLYLLIEQAKKDFPHA